MAAIHDLLRQITDDNLRTRLTEEIKKLEQKKKFGLVFEEHLPECAPLYQLPIRVGSNVAKKAGRITDIYTVLEMDGKDAVCQPLSAGVPVRFPLQELVTVAKFGDAIFPSLESLGKVKNAPDSSLWHTLIEADNFHALQLLEYLYPQKVDCIYIDPPYNTGAKDWKYNNDYVDGSDAYRHSKWLSMMQKRLELAKKILNPDDSVLIVTIDEKEYLHLGCLLEEMFPDAQTQMISTFINPSGVNRNNMFARTNEYVFFVFMGNCRPTELMLGDEWIGQIKNRARRYGLRWGTLMRTGTGSLRSDSPNLFYPVFVSSDGKKIVSVGDTYYGSNREEIKAPNGTIAIWPIRRNGAEGRWQLSREKLLQLIDKGYVRLGSFNDRGTIAIDYIPRGEAKKIEDGLFKITGKNENDFTVEIDDEDYVPNFIPGCQWNIPSHDATQQGSKLLYNIVGKRFSFPKSLYAVHDAIRFFVANKPNALIVDFFAGSGTTLHAVNLLNSEDNGNRRCILVTNNEVSDAEAKKLAKAGHQPGDEAWENLGIARYVTWPRTVCSIKGEDVNGQPLKGNYLGSDRPMSEGFPANVEYFKLGFLDKDSVSLGAQFREILPLLWLKAGAIGERPELDGEDEPPMLILPQNDFAVLLAETHFSQFLTEMENVGEIHTIYFVTDSEDVFRSMSAHFGQANTYQLYRDYIDNFVLGTRNRGSEA